MFWVLFGILCGVLSETFDQMSAMTSYVITPLTFLSALFILPIHCQNLEKCFGILIHSFYILDGFRYSIAGVNDGNLLTGQIYILV